MQILHEHLGHEKSFFLLVIEMTTAHFGLGHHMRFGFFCIYKFLTNCSYIMNVFSDANCLIISLVSLTPQCGHRMDYISILVIFSSIYAFMHERQMECEDDKKYETYPY